MTKAISPKMLAVWTLPQLQARLAEWAYEVYDQTEHPALGQSPRDAYEQRMAETGLRRHRLVAYDDAFLLATMPSTRKGTAKVIAIRGVQINALYYWTRAFSDPALLGEQLPVRYDPFDVGTAFAYVRGRWERCYSRYASVFRGRSERELQLATAEIRRQTLNHARCLTVTAKRLADFLQSATADENLMAQHMRDAEQAATQLPTRLRCESDEHGVLDTVDDDHVVDEDDGPLEEVIYPASQLPEWLRRS